MTAFLLAHLSDPHLGPLPQPRLRELASKRAFGYFNWRRNRRGSLKPEILATLLLDLKAQSPHHLAVTGDLVNIALQAEIPAALEWLRAIGSPEWVSLVPGNHDAYVQSAIIRADTVWDLYMAGDPGTSPPHLPRFPYLRIRRRVAILGVSSAIATGFFMATGEVGAVQRARLAELLQLLAAEGFFRVVLIHHPPIPGSTPWHKRLEDARAVAGTLAQAGAELVLHGHTHLPTIHWIPGERPIPVVGVPSASAAPGGTAPPAAYNLFCIQGEPPAWQVELITRGFGLDGEPIGERRRLPLTPAAAPLSATG